MEYPDDYASQKVVNVDPSRPDPRSPAAWDTETTAEVVAIPLLSLRSGDSPRINGVDRAHIARLVETETPLPPILVNRRTMRVIDGMHRLMVASLRGRETIDVKFFVGNETDAFLRGVQENVAHGLPLSQADRRAAAKRVIESHPHLSDRAIGHSVGLAAQTIAGIRKSSSKISQSDVRVGRDGRVRPLDSGLGRRRAAEILAQQPDMSLRDAARAAGISPATVRDVRKRLERGQSPVPDTLAASAARKGGSGDWAKAGADSGGTSTASAHFSSTVAGSPQPAVAVERLLRDPSLRDNDRGKAMLRLLHVNALAAEHLPHAVTCVPSHCVVIVVLLARQYAKMWHDFARELDERTLIIDPLTATRGKASQSSA